MNVNQTHKKEKKKTQKIKAKSKIPNHNILT